MPWWDLGTGVALAAAAVLSLVAARGRWKPLPVDVALWSGFAALAASALWTSAPSLETMLRWMPMLWVPLALRRQHRAWNEGLIAGGIVLSFGLLGHGAYLAFAAQSLEPLFYRDFAEFAHQHSYLTLYLGLAGASVATDLRFRGAIRPLLLGVFALVAVLGHVEPELLPGRGDAGDAGHDRRRGGVRRDGTAGRPRGRGGRRPAGVAPPDPA